MAQPWFEIDRKGLAQLRDATPKSQLVFELVQNAWDTDATQCSVTLTHSGGKTYYLRVEDNDPNGFENLRHAYTLFAPSNKKGNPEKRGRFNLGEKLVLAMCLDAEILSTKGGVRFTAAGRVETKKRTDVGSVFHASINMTRAEADEISKSMAKLIPPAKCNTFFNCGRIAERDPLVVTEASLPTVLADNEGNLRPTRRKTAIVIYAAYIGEEPMIYEMGIPVVESGDRFHYNVMQKVPLSIDRDNVTPAFLRDVRKAAAEATIDYITAEDAHSEWVRTAAADPEASPELVKKAFTERFGEDAVIYDPSDPMANHTALANGFVLVTGSQLSKDEWANVKRHEIAIPAGHRFPSVPERESVPKVTCPLCGGAGTIQQP